MTDKNQAIADSVSRRAILQKGAATGAVLAGGTAMAGSTAAQGRAVAYISDSPNEGDSHTLAGPNVTEEVRCHQPSQADGHNVDGYVTNDGTWVQVQSNSVDLEAGDDIEVAKVIGECRQNSFWTKVQIKEV